jgi:hypothetical protein
MTHYKYPKERFLIPSRTLVPMTSFIANCKLHSVTVSQNPTSLMTNTQNNEFFHCKSSLLCPISFAVLWQLGWCIIFFVFINRCCVEILSFLDLKLLFSACVPLALILRLDFVGCDCTFRQLYPSCCVVLIHILSNVGVCIRETCEVAVIFALWV